MFYKVVGFYISFVVWGKDSPILWKAVLINQILVLYLAQPFTATNIFSLISYYLAIIWLVEALLYYTRITSNIYNVLCSTRSHLNFCDWILFFETYNLVSF